MLDWLKSVWARWKVQVSFVGGALVVATTYGTCTVDPPSVSEATTTTEETITVLPTASTTTTDDAASGTTEEATTTTTEEASGDEAAETTTTTEQYKSRWQTGEKSAAFFKKSLTFKIKVL